METINIILGMASIIMGAGMTYWACFRSQEPKTTYNYHPKYRGSL